MLGTIWLDPISPTGADRTLGLGLYGAERWYGSHKGEDFLANWGSDVYATEDGVVVFSDMIEGSVERTRYGETVIIDHTPKAGIDKRHIYTLYAHLNVKKVDKGDKVEKEMVIGTSGNSGTSKYYVGRRDGTKRGREGGFHLHFEVIDTEKLGKALDWSQSSWPSGYRIDPIKDYIGKTITIKYSPSKEERRDIVKKLKFELDLVRGSFCIVARYKGRKVGHLNEKTKRFTFTA